LPRWRTRLNAAKVGFDMGVPFNELNRAFDLGFKRLPHGDICYLSKNLQSVGMLSEPPPPSKTGSQLSTQEMHPSSNGQLRVSRLLFT
jgi:hypothetical protein